MTLLQMQYFQAPTKCRHGIFLVECELYEVREPLLAQIQLFKLPACPKSLQSGYIILFQVQFFEINKGLKALNSLYLVIIEAQLYHVSEVALSEDPIQAAYLIFRQIKNRNSSAQFKIFYL
ncbi:hypothetical protein FGO68_gene2706 [Halteria grandinella]|uniref:Uncharacterized protein n=1 Tax=Halteria grandinella TaxID=5974 RepID=A0A8J8NFI7_HALGN|nr:hypothetical protein FGO68_gene2706 [Halteria grandinella]